MIPNGPHDSCFGEATRKNFDGIFRAEAFLPGAVPIFINPIKT